LCLENSRLFSSLKTGGVMRTLLLRTAAIVAIGSFVIASSPTISKSKNKAEQVKPWQAKITLVPKNTIVEQIIAKEDDRVERLERYFQAKNSPFSGNAASFVAIADKYQLDWTLLPAIANLESQLGKLVLANSYNPYGWNNGKMKFISWVEATETVASGIRSRYAPTGEVTAYRIGGFYAESPTWAARVTKFQAEIRSY